MLTVVIHLEHPFDTLTLTVADAAGNGSSDTVSVTITKTDNVAPTITPYSASATQLTWLASQNDSADKTVTFTVVTSDDVAIGSVATFWSNSNKC